jgi:acetyl-CoA carboxylase biotin carboxyl carrier protein
MTVEEIKELIQIVNDSGIAELEVQRGDDRVRIRRATGTAHEYVLAHGSGVAPVVGPMTHDAQPQPHGAAVVAPSHPVPNPAAAPHTLSASEAERVYVKSPIVGTFYEASSPESPPFVKVGDRVTPGQVLCIIESMKLMNEIESEVSGTIVAKLVENGRPVEYGESLFAVQPS